MDRFKDDRQVGVAYLYFDYKNRDNQPKETIIANLLHQLIIQLDELPHEIELLYDRYQRSPPEYSKLLDALVRCSKEFGSVQFMLDAFDECSEGQQDNLLRFIHCLMPSY